MAQEHIAYTIPSDGANNGSQVNLLVTFDATSPNADGSYTITDASGTYATLDASGNVINTDNITGLGDFGGEDQHFFLSTSPSTSPIVDYNGITFHIDNANDSNDGSGNVNFFDNNGPADGSAPTDTPSYLEDSSNHTTAAAVSVMCFVSGTRILTTQGEIAVDALRVGNMVVTASGRHRPIRWLGHRVFDCLPAPDAASRYPVRILADAFGPGVPKCDLMLSPGHPVLVGADVDGTGGHLVPIMCLINGTTIARIPVDQVTYWHVELDVHDILLAENLPAESYLDLGERAFFTPNADDRLADFEFVVPELPGRCRPVAVDGQIVEVERCRLETMFVERLAKACFWPSHETLVY